MEAGQSILNNQNFMQTVRFSQVVARCGEPVTHVQWVALEKDAELQAALKQERVMTVHIQTVGSKKDHGEIGLSEKGQRALLIFPKTLRGFAGKRVVGINYDLLYQEEAAEPEKPAEPASPPPARQELRLVKKAASKPREKAEEPVTAQARKPAAQPKPKPKPVPKAKAVPKASKKVTTGKRTPGGKDPRVLIKKAMTQLSQGKEVAAYQTLESALDSWPQEVGRVP